LSKSAILAQTERILADHHFRTSKRCSSFLRYVVRETCNQHPERLKERSLGVEVFHRDPEYDTNQDPVVRTTAGEVRKRLAQYYMEPANRDELRICLPPGTYVAEFEEPEGAKRSQRSRWLILGLSGGAVIVLGLAVWAVTALGRPASALARFWEPVIASPSRVVVCIGQPQVFDFTAETQQQLYDRFRPGGETSRNSAAEKLGSVSVADMVPMWNRYVVLGDAKALAELSRFFARRAKQFRVRGVRETSLGDLRGQPVVLIGAFNNPWTVKLTRDSRFYFDSDAQYGCLSIRDRQNPDESQWLVADSWPEWDVTKDYAIVTRLYDHTTESTIVAAGGLAQYGTIAAAEFLTNESYIKQAVQAAPSDWADKNIQIVISTQVINGESGPPKVEAVHVWE